MSDNETQLSFSIINTEMTVEAMRDSGYKSTTHALAELIDNSIEAGAREVEILGLSQWKQQTNRVSLVELAVMDDGEGWIPTLFEVAFDTDMVHGEAEGVSADSE